MGWELITGLHLNRKLAKIHFYLMFVGVNIIFFPQHFLGLRGMPRRYSDYSDYHKFWNSVSSFGRFIVLLRIFVFFIILIESFVYEKSICFVDRYSNNIERISFYPPSDHRFTDGYCIYINNTYYLKN